MNGGWTQWRFLGADRARSAGAGAAPTGCRRRASARWEVFGLRFPGTVGLAAGFDKNARAWPAAAALGFGHVEIGTVTALAQPGNPRPRMFRYPAQGAVINRMGFNNDGAAAVAARLARHPGPGHRRIPLGVNLGKSKAPTWKRAAGRLSRQLLAPGRPCRLPGAQCFEPQYARPAPASGRVPAQGAPGDDLRRQSGAGRAAGKAAGADSPENCAGPFPSHQIDAVLGAILEYSLDGIIATNTTLARPGAILRGSNEAGWAERGAASPPLDRDRRLYRQGDRRGGSRSSVSGESPTRPSAAEKLDAGASLVQVYTGMVYRGPFFAAELAEGLADRQRR